MDTAIDVHVEGTKRRIIAADENIVPSLRIRMVGDADELRSTEHLEVVKVPVEVEGRKRYEGRWTCTLDANIISAKTSPYGIYVKLCETCRTSNL